MEEKLAKYFSGEASEEEKQQIISWRNDSDENASLFFEYKQTWAKTLFVEPTRQASSITGQEETTKEPESKSFFMGMGWLKYAASIVILIVAGIIVSVYWEDWTTRPTGLTTSMKLEDGTQVTMYRDAVVEQLSFTNNERIVKVSGKVYFDVEEDKKRPFIIYTQEAMVKVLGTSFVVNAEEDKYTTEVIVESGLVTFSANPKANKNLRASIKLSKGEKGIISPRAKGIIKQNNRDNNFLAWQNQLIVFKQEKLEDVSEMINEVYGYQIQFDNKELKNCRLSAKYNRKTPEEIAKLIAETFGFEYQITSDRQIKFSGSSCF